MPGQTLIRRFDTTLSLSQPPEEGTATSSRQKPWEPAEHLSDAANSCRVRDATPPPLRYTCEAGARAPPQSPLWAPSNKSQRCSQDTLGGDGLPGHSRDLCRISFLDLSPLAVPVRSRSVQGRCGWNALSVCRKSAHVETSGTYSQAYPRDTTLCFTPTRIALMQ